MGAYPGEQNILRQPTVDNVAEPPMASHSVIHRFPEAINNTELGYFRGVKIMGDLSVNGGAAIPGDSAHPDIRTTSESAEQSTSALPTNASLEGLARLSERRPSNGGDDDSDLDDPLETRYQRAMDAMPIDVEGGLREALDSASQQDDNTGA